MTDQKLKAKQFLDMHHDSSILVLPNAWDAISARIFEEVGFPAIATTSVGVAAALGYADGHAPCDEVVEATRRITRAVQVPVTADIESGYGTSIEEVAQNAEKFLSVGVVGINLEDSIRRSDNPIEAIDQQARKIRAIRELADARNIPLVINARTDVLLRPDKNKQALIDEACERARAYKQAGADCIYVFGMHGKATIEQLVARIESPINILAGPLTPPVNELQSMGVARVSIGGGAIEAALGLVKRTAMELFTEGTYSSFLESPMSYQEINSYFK